jgi:hypothetical protein
MHYELRSRVKSHTTLLKGDIEYRKGSRLAFSLDDVSYGKQTSRIYEASGSHLTAYDNFSDEVINTTAPIDRSLAERVSYRFSVVPDPVSAVGDPQWVGKFLHAQGSVSGFKGHADPQGYTLTRPGKGKGDYSTFLFNRNHLLQRVSVLRGGNVFVWSIGYGNPSKRPTIPSGGQQVAAFHKHRPLPQYATVGARTLSLQVLRAARKIRPSQIVIKRPGQQTVVFWNHGKVRQNGDHSSWSYDGKKLWVSVGNSFYEGKASHADALNYLAYLTKGEETLARAFLLQVNPFDEFFDPDSTVRIVGPMSVEGTPSTILQIEGRATKSSLIIKDGNNMVEEVWTDTIDSHRKVLSHDEASFHYLPLPSDSPSLFQLPKPPHAKLKPLPKNAIHLGQFHPTNH